AGGGAGPRVSRGVLATSTAKSPNRGAYHEPPPMALPRRRLSGRPRRGLLVLLPVRRVRAGPGCGDREAPGWGENPLHPRRPRRPRARRRRAHRGDGGGRQLLLPREPVGRVFPGRGRDPLAAAVRQGRLPEGDGGPQAGPSPKFGEDDEHGGRRPLPTRGGETTLTKGVALPR